MVLCHWISVFFLDPQPLKTKVLFSFEILRNHNSVMQCHIPEDLNPQCLTNFVCELHHAIQL